LFPSKEKKDQVKLIKTQSRYIVNAEKILYWFVGKNDIQKEDESFILWARLGEGKDLRIVLARHESQAVLSELSEALFEDLAGLTNNHFEIEMMLEQIERDLSSSPF
jgi:hypothetical protein